MQPLVVLLLAPILSEVSVLLVPFRGAPKRLETDESRLNKIVVFLGRN